MDAAQSVSIPSNAALTAGVADAFSPWLFQQWRDLLFIHWRVAPETLAPRIPAPLALDLRDGSAVVGLVAFEVASTRTSGPFSLPLAGSFGEINVRTYVRGPGGERGIWYFSLDAASRAAVVGARLAFHLPYQFARVKVLRCNYEREIWSSRPDHSGRCVVSWTARPAEPESARFGSLEEFLLERYVLYTGKKGEIYRTRVFHDPYPLAPVELGTLDQTLLEAAGLSVGRTRPSIHYSPGVDVAVSPPERLESRACAPIQYAAL